MALPLVLSTFKVSSNYFTVKKKNCMGNSWSWDFSQHVKLCESIKTDPLTMWELLLSTRVSLLDYSATYQSQGVSCMKTDWLGYVSLNDCQDCISNPRY